MFVQASHSTPKQERKVSETRLRLIWFMVGVVVYIVVLSPAQRFLTEGYDGFACFGLRASDVQEIDLLLDQVEADFGANDTWLNACYEDESAVEAWVALKPETEADDVVTFLSGEGFRPSDVENCYQYSEGRRRVVYWLSTDGGENVTVNFYLERSRLSDVCSALDESIGNVASTS